MAAGATRVTLDISQVHHGLEKAISDRRLNLESVWLRVFLLGERLNRSWRREVARLGWRLRLRFWCIFYSLLSAGGALGFNIFRGSGVRLWLALGG